MARIFSMRGSQGTDPTSPTDPNYNQMVVGISYYTDDTYTTVATPTGGTITIEGRINGNTGWSEMSDSPIDCTDDSASVTTSVPIVEIRASATGLDAGVYYQVTVTANSH